MKQVSKFKAGHFENLAKNCHNAFAAFDPFEEFEETFNKFQTHIMVTTWQWRYRKEEPYVMITPISIFDNLNLMALRISNLLKDHTNGEGHSLSVEYTDGSLDICVDDFHVVCDFIEFNRVDDSNQHEGWKFEIPECDNTTVLSIRQEPFTVAPFSEEEQVPLIEVEGQASTEVEEPPMYVSLKGTALRKVGKKYYRDSGNWEVEFIREVNITTGETQLLSVCPSHKQLDRVILIPITEEQWREGNYGGER
jgi:hypothetical protein